MTNANTANTQAAIDRINRERARAKDTLQRSTVTNANTQAAIDRERARAKDADAAKTERLQPSAPGAVTALKQERMQERRWREQMSKMRCRNCEGTGWRKLQDDGKEGQFTAACRSCGTSSRFHRDAELVITYQESQPPLPDINTDGDPNMRKLLEERFRAIIREEVTDIIRTELDKWAPD